MPRRLCTFPGCYKAYHSNGLCTGHLTQRRQGRRLAPLKEYAPRKNLVLDRPLDKMLVARLEAAALRYANAETNDDFAAARRALLTRAVALTWKSRRAVHTAHPSPAQGPEGVTSDVPGPSSAQKDLVSRGMAAGSAATHGRAA